MHGAKNLLIHAAAIATATMIFILLYAELFAPPVQADLQTPKEDQAHSDVRLALLQFGTERDGNFCPILFGGREMRGDLVARVHIIWAERQAMYNRDLASVLQQYQGTRLYAWVDVESAAVFLTDRFWNLSRHDRMATLFHEVRGHLEMGYSDPQMRAVLCPGADPGDSHCISIEIAKGCPALRGMSTETALAAAERGGRSVVPLFIP